MNNLLNKWHSKLNMPKHDLEWHKRDMSDEMKEMEEAHGLFHLWSELSDVVYTYTRAKWSGHTEIEFPFSNAKFCIGTVYMIPKYSLRWNFYNRLGKIIDGNLHITEVRNPKKEKKLEDIALKYNIDPNKFKSEAEKLMKRWVFLD